MSYFVHMFITITVLLSIHLSAFKCGLLRLRIIQDRDTSGLVKTRTELPHSPDSVATTKRWQMSAVERVSRSYVIFPARFLWPEMPVKCRLEVASVGTLVLVLAFGGEFLVSHH